MSKPHNYILIRKLSIVPSARAMKRRCKVHQKPEEPQHDVPAVMSRQSEKRKDTVKNTKPGILISLPGCSRAWFLQPLRGVQLSVPKATQECTPGLLLLQLHLKSQWCSLLHTRCCSGHRDTDTPCWGEFCISSKDQDSSLHHPKFN